MPQPHKISFNVRGKFGSPASSEYYTFLKLESTAPTKDIKSSYKKLANIYHPDRKTGDMNKFKKLQHIYETLTDDVSRICYDSFGPDYESIEAIDHFKQSLKAKPKVITIKLTLSDIIKGVTKHVKYSTFTRYNTIITSEKDIIIPPNLKLSGKPMLYPGEGNNNNCSIRGDLVIQIEEILDEEFKRVNNHLIARVKCCVLGIIISSPLRITHPSGEDLYIKLDSSIAGDNMIRVKGNGMDSDGDLFIQVIPLFPDNITQEQKDGMSQLFDLSSVLDESEISTLTSSTKVSIENVEELIQSGREHSQPQQVGCPVQ